MKLGGILQLRDPMQSYDSSLRYLPGGKTKIFNKRNPGGSWQFKYKPQIRSIEIETYSLFWKVLLVFQRIRRTITEFNKLEWLAFVGESLTYDRVREDSWVLFFYWTASGMCNTEQVASFCAVFYLLSSGKDCLVAGGMGEHLSPPNIFSAHKRFLLACVSPTCFIANKWYWQWAP